MGDYEVNVDVSINSYGGPGGSLRISERVMIPECTFSDMAAILEGFHKLAQAIKAQKEAAKV